MLIRIIFCSLFFFTCAAPPPPSVKGVKIKQVKKEPLKQPRPELFPPTPVALPPTKDSRPDLVQETVKSRGYLTGYDIWEFLREQPAETDVLETFGLPDSIWLDDEERTKFLYYFISEMQDYNIIEISTKTDSVSGFEWD